jgi:hypothetical protein
MLLNKTEKARDALGAGPSAGLALQDRRILILTDGKRSLNQVMAMLGPDILPAIDRLMREGYITRDDAVAAHPATAVRPPALGGAVTGLLRAATEAVQARTEQIRAATPAPSASAPGAAPTPAAPASPHIATAAAVAPRPSSGTRRSLAASKMYLLDMLQLQRSPEAAELRAAIQCSEPAQLVDTLFQALRVLVGTSTQSYGERIANRLAEILPEETLPRLEALRAERAGVATLSIVAA